MLKLIHYRIGRALAASAPVHQFLDHYNCGDFNQRLTKSYQEYSQNCVDGIRNSWSAFRRVAASNFDNLKSLFKMCNSSQNNYSVDDLIEFVIDILTLVGMVDYQLPANFLKPLPAYPMKVGHHSFVRPTVRRNGLLLVP
jgi:lysosomal Pro-X carboxypeptidase